MSVRARRRRWPRLALIALSTAGINLGLIIILARLGDGVAGPREAPPRTVAFTALAVTPPALSEPLADAAAGTAPSVEAAVPAEPPTAPPLPALDLAVTSRRADALRLPWPAFAVGDLPVFVPALPVGRIAAGGGVPSPPLAAVTAQLDTPPQLVGGFDLERFYPRQARRWGQSGHSVVELRIDARGRVVDGTVIASEPPGVFEDAALRGARTLTFVPARQGDGPAPATVRLRIDWQLRP